MPTFGLEYLGRLDQGLPRTLNNSQEVTKPQLDTLSATNSFQSNHIRVNTYPADLVVNQNSLTFQMVIFLVLALG